LARTRAQLAALSLRDPNGPVTAHRAQLGRLRDEIDQLESEVSARSAAFRAESSAVTLDAVQAALPSDATLVEFTRYLPSDETPGVPLAPRYAAYTLPASGEARWADLGGAAEIERAIEAWRSALGDPRRTDTSRLARAVDTRVFQPVRNLLGGTRHLLVSPDGPLNLIPFAALIDEHGNYLLDRYTITYLTSGRDLLRLQVARERKGQPVIVAAPDFGDPPLVPGSRAKVDYSQVFFGPLPGVRDEARALETLLPNATRLIGEHATEAALKQVAGPTILHIATHGFFLPDRDATTDRPSAASGDRRRLGRWAAWTENPLLRSGLALAGANQGGRGDDDGVLTALEAAGLDLWGTKLVVLSACDTGVGDVKEGDGVYGLRRALVLAGSESQLMSLWAVSDRSTRDLMIGYYSRLNAGQGRGDALQQVQRETRNNPRHAHPYYWAGFIQSGQWTTLSLGR
jgi:CHAT domain-containing protein